MNDISNLIIEHPSRFASDRLNRLAILALLIAMRGYNRDFAHLSLQKRVIFAALQKKSE